MTSSEVKDNNLDKDLKNTLKILRDLYNENKITDI